MKFLLVPCAAVLALMVAVALMVTPPQFKPHWDDIKPVMTTGIYRCTAFPIGHHAYMTAKHCLPVSHIGEEPVVDTYQHPTADVAVLIVEGNALRSLRFASKPAKLGDRVWVAGWARGAYLSITEGFQGKDRDVCSADTMGGCSGAPVLDKRGKVLGVVVMGMQYEYLTKYVLYEDFAEWLTHLPL